MTKAAEKILAEAMALAPDERLALAQTLLENAALSADPNYSTDWSVEIDRRVQEYEYGDIEAKPWDEVRRRLIEERRSA